MSKKIVLVFVIEKPPSPYPIFLIILFCHHRKQIHISYLHKHISYQYFCEVTNHPYGIIYTFNYIKIFFDHPRPYTSPSFQRLLIVKTKLTHMKISLWHDFSSIIKYG